MECGSQPEFDGLAIVIDWLDACRARDVGSLLRLYDGAASLQCACSGTVHTGHQELESYWRGRLSGAAAAAFRIEEIAPRGETVVLDYRSFEDKPVRMVFAFSPSGKISQSHCEPRAV